MEQCKFTVYGHKNIRGEHRTTLEFTKESDLSLQGDCIIGIKATFDKEEVKKLAESGGKARMKLATGNLEETIEFELNPEWDDDKEIVIRMGEFVSKRTLGIHASKSSKTLSRKMINMMKDPEQEMVVEIEKTA